MERKGSGVSFMDVFSDPVYFNTLYTHLYNHNNAALRLVCKELRDAVNLNARGLSGNVDRDGYRPISMSGLISKLPNLKSIHASASFSSSGIVNLFQGAQLARKLTKLRIRNTDAEDEEFFEDMPLTDEDRKRRVAILENSFGTISYNQWPSLKILSISGLDMTITPQSMEGLVHLSALTCLGLDQCTFNDDSFNLIPPGSWPCLRTLDVREWSIENSTAFMKALVHITGLQELDLAERGITSRAIAQFQPRSWPNLQMLDLKKNPFHDNPMAVVAGLLHLTSLTKLDLYECSLDGEAFSQIKRGDWPHLKFLDLMHNELSDDPVGLINGLLHLSSLQQLDVANCGLTGEAVSLIKPGDWPHIKWHDFSDSDLSDNPLGAMQGLLHLTSVTDLELSGCHLNGRAISKLKPGDWPLLQSLSLFDNDLSDDKEGAMDGLLHLTKLKILSMNYAGLNEEEVSEILTALGIQQRVL